MLRETINIYPEPLGSCKIRHPLQQKSRGWWEGYISLKQRAWFESQHYETIRPQILMSTATLPFSCERGQRYLKEGELNEKNVGLGNAKHR